MPKPNELIVVDAMPTKRTRVVVGMPHLSFGGLSENWLLKECGHLHWQLLAMYFRSATSDFRDQFDNRLYPAFIAIELRDAELAAVRENDHLEIDSRIRRLDRSRFCSTHKLVGDHSPGTTVEMVSIFLRRRTPSDNHSVERAHVQLDDHESYQCDADPHPLSKISRSLRNSASDEQAYGFRLGARRISRRFKFRPCPHGDFNGADFLYFAAYQAITDRAEWHWEFSTPKVPRTSSRQLFYYGNIDVGDSLEIRCCGFTQDAEEFGHWCEIVRQSDGKRIADIFTKRRFVP